MVMMASVAVMLLPAVLGFHRYVILTGSMTGTYDRGSVVFDRQTSVSALRVGDPITYSPPPGFTSQTRVTHRIWSITRGPNGERIFKTKGDANNHPDVWKFTLNQAMQDKVIFHIPELGYLFTLLSLRNFRIVLVGVPALIIGLIMLRGAWREGGVEARRQKLAQAGWRALPGRAGQTVLAPLTGPAVNPVPTWIELRLRPVRARSGYFLRRAAAVKRPRIDLSAPLRVRRLISALPMAAHDGGGPSRRRLDRMSGSRATIQLCVVRLGARPETREKAAGNPPGV